MVKYFCVCGEPYFNKKAFSAHTSKCKEHRELAEEVSKEPSFDAENPDQLLDELFVEFSDIYNRYMSIKPDRDVCDYVLQQLAILYGVAEKCLEDKEQKIKRLFEIKEDIVSHYTGNTATDVDGCNEVCTSLVA